MPLEYAKIKAVLPCGRHGLLITNAGWFAGRETALCQMLTLTLRRQETYRSRQNRALMPQVMPAVHQMPQ